MPIIERHVFGFLGNQDRWYAESVADSQLVVYVCVFPCDDGYDCPGLPDVFPNVRHDSAAAIDVVCFRRDKTDFLRGGFDDPFEIAGEGAAKRKQYETEF